MSRWSARTGHGYVYLDVTRTSYNQAGNYSTFSFNLWFDADSGYGPSYDYESYYRLEIDPGNHVYTQSSHDFSITAGGTHTFTSGSLNITHDANGYLTLSVAATVTAHAGSTIDGTFNINGTAAQPRIPKAPSQPPAPVLKAVTSSSLEFYLDGPSNVNGAGTTQYNYQVDNDSNFSSPVSDVTANEIVGRDSGSAGSLTPPGSKWYVRQRWANVAGWSPWSSALPITLNVVAPAATTKPSVTRVSDTQQTISWTRNASTSAPYSSQQVQRRQFSGGAWGAWTAVATVGTAYTDVGANSITDSGTASNGQYQYRVKATNNAGESYSVESTSAFTTPAAPTSFTAEKQSSGSITLTLVQGVSHAAYKTTIQYSLNAGGTWTALTTLASGINTYSWTPPAGSSVVFQASVAVDATGSAGTGLTSGWTQSNSVGLTAPPNPPSSLDPNGPAFDAAITAKDFTWKHNTVDSSAQSAYEIQYRIGTGAWVSTGKVTSTTSKRTFPAGTFVNGNSYQWQVRTYGAHATASPWSATATFVASASPSVAITSPSATLGSALVTLTWDFTDPEGTAQSMWEAELRQGGVAIETHSGSGATTSVDFTTRLTDGTEYQILVRGRDGSSLWSAWDQQTFTTDFPFPVMPVVGAEFDTNTGNTTITVNNPAGIGAWTELARNLATNPSFETASGTVAVRTNLATDPAAASGGSGWGTSGTTVSATQSADTTFFHSGNTSLKKVINATGQTGAKCPATFTIAQGEYISWSFWVYSTRAGIIIPYIDGTDAVTGSYSAVSASAQVVPANTWTKISATGTTTLTNGFTTKQGAGGYNLQVQAGDTVWFDEFLIEKSPTVNSYFDGSTPAEGDFTYAWTGTANASTSVQTAPGVATLTSSHAFVYQSKDWSSSGSLSACISPFDSSNDSFVTFGTEFAMQLGMQAGKTYTVLAKCRLSAPQTGATYADRARGICVVSNPQGNRTVTHTSLQAPNAVGTFDVLLTFTLDPTVNQAAIRVYNGASQGGGDVWWDDLIVVEGEYDGNYFDGDSESHYLAQHRWLGTPGASASVYEERDYVDYDTGNPTTLENVIMRSTDGGISWDEVGSTPVDGTGFDKTVPLGLVDVLYKVIAWSDLPSSSETEPVAISTVVYQGFWSAGPALENLLPLRINKGDPPKIDLKTSPYQKVLHYFAGRTSPVETIGEATLVEGSVEFIVTSVADRDRARAMALLPAPHLLRLPDGTTVFSSVGPVAEKRLAEGWYQLSFEITEVDR